jgi:hypothetical protein
MHPLPFLWSTDSPWSGVAEIFIFTVLRPAQEYFTYMETSPLPVNGTIKIPPCSKALSAEHRPKFCSPPAVTRDLGFSGLIRRTAPSSRLLRHTRGCGEPILTRILTGPYLRRPTYKCIVAMSRELTLLVTNTYLTVFITPHRIVTNSYRFAICY